MAWDSETELIFILIIMKGDIIKVEKPGVVVIGIEDKIEENRDVWFSAYIFSGHLYIQRGFIRATVVPITEEERNDFKYRLLEKGYTYDEEIKELIYEI